jgi:hypothetical protein
MTEERIARGYLAALAEVRWISDVSFPADVVAALGEHIEPAELGGMPGRRLTRAGALVVLSWRATEGRLLADLGIWLEQHVRAGHLTIKRGRGSTLHAIVDVRTAPFESSAVKSLRDWSVVQAAVYTRYLAPPEAPK